MTDQELIDLMRGAISSEGTLNNTYIVEHFNELPGLNTLYTMVVEQSNRIEELVKERDELGRKLNTARYGQPDFAWSIQEEEMSDLRVKLAKAVDALRFYAYGHSTPPTWYHAHTVLSEIEGDVK